MSQPGGLAYSPVLRDTGSNAVYRGLRNVVEGTQDYGGAAVSVRFRTDFWLESLAYPAVTSLRLRAGSDR
jgi:hypothetical protein